MDNTGFGKKLKVHLKNKKVICSIYHIDFEKFDKKQEKTLQFR